jgi:hypothetical protein
MEALLLLMFAVAKSGFPSPLMSPMLTDQGRLLVGKSTLVAKVGVVAPVGGGVEQDGGAVAVDVRRC